jgi:hypothetical protein
MKRKPKHLDVDFISGLGPLSAEEDHMLSEYLKKQNLKAAKRKVQGKAASA